MITGDEIKKSIMKKMDLTLDEKIIFLFYNKKKMWLNSQYFSRGVVCGFTKVCVSVCVCVPEHVCVCVSQAGPCSACLMRWKKVLGMRIREEIVENLLKARGETGNSYKAGLITAMCYNRITAVE